MYYLLDNCASIFASCGTKDESNDIAGGSEQGRITNGSGGNEQGGTTDGPGDGENELSTEGIIYRAYPTYAEVTGYEGSAKEVYVAPTYNGLPVTNPFKPTAPRCPRGGSFV